MSVLDEVRTIRRGSPDDGGRAIRPPRGRRDRRILVMVTSTALVAVSVAAFAGLYSTADHSSPALVVTAPVAQGQLLTASDVGSVEISVPSGVATVPVSEAATVVGRHAATRLAPGSLLTVSDLASGPVVGAGDAVVGIALKDGTYPAAGLSPGDEVMVVQTAAPGAALTSPTGSSSATVDPVTSGVGGVTVQSGPETGSGVLVPQATVFSVATPGPNSSGGYALLISVVVSTTMAADVATAAAAAQIGIVLLGTSGAAASVPSVPASATGGGAP